MQQNKITILSTRSLDDEFILDANSKDVALEIISFIKAEPISSAKSKEQIMQALTASPTVVFTSVNAVEAVALRLKDQRPQWKIFCIGHATRRSVAKYFGERSIAGVADNAKKLAATILDANIKEVIFFCGDQRRDELPELVRKDNVEVKEIVVYKTIATPRKISKKYDGILFFSPSAVKSFFENNVTGSQTVLFAIGSATADEIKRFSENKIVISDAPDKKNLLEKVLFYFQTNPSHH